MEADILNEMDWDNKYRCIRSTESRLTVMKYHIGKKILEFLQIIPNMICMLKFIYYGGEVKTV